MIEKATKSDVDSILDRLLLADANKARAAEALLDVLRLPDKDYAELLHKLEKFLEGETP
jgi:hypothetical protein